MIFFRFRALLLLIILLTGSVLFARMVEGEENVKGLDLNNWHNVGNIWLRVSNYGFFGAGSGTNPPWPSLEYPGGSGQDYLYQGALWFGAKKERRNASGELLYWEEFPSSSTPYGKVNPRSNIPGFNPEIHKIVVDTLVAVGFDGDRGLNQLLPAWNPLENRNPLYSKNNYLDKVIEASTRVHRRGIDDDGDGLIDEDPLGVQFPFRDIYDLNKKPEYRRHGLANLPKAFHGFSGLTIADAHNDTELNAATTISDNVSIWFFQGFEDLSLNYYNLAYNNFGERHEYNFTQPFDNDGDILQGEDGAPISEQDYISYYYDYSPLGTKSNREYGRDAGRGDNYIPLNIFVRQTSYQWSFDYIKNLVYVEFNITNMNSEDILYDCVMGIYMDCDIGPQAFDSSKASDDKSGYVSGKGYEFAYSFDDGANKNLTPGIIGARVTNPDPDSLQFACWFWKVGQGPNHFRPTRYGNPEGDGKKTANEKYWLLSGRNPNPNYYQSLRDNATSSPTGYWEQPTPMDTRFLFGFYGSMEGYDNVKSGNPQPEDWNLYPGETMKIVIAVFPGANIDELKDSATWARIIYRDAQGLTTVVLPDTVEHYRPPEPPNYPRMYAEMVEDTPNRIDLNVYWDNRSEFTQSETLVDRSKIGWNTRTGLDSDYTVITNWEDIPYDFRPRNLYPGANQGLMNVGAVVNPYTAHRLKHDFEGYSLKSRSGRGDRDAWMLRQMWDKVQTEQDHQDYMVNYGADAFFLLEGETGYEIGLPNQWRTSECFIHPNDTGGKVKEEDVQPDGYWYGYYKLNDLYFPEPIKAGDVVYGSPLYNKNMTAAIAKIILGDDFELGELPDGTPKFLTQDVSRREARQLLFKHPSVPDEIYLALVDDSLIPLEGHIGWNRTNRDIVNPVESNELIEERLTRRYYHRKLDNIPKGREFYVSVTAFNRGMPASSLAPLESGTDANMRIFFPGPLAKPKMNNIYVVPNPYRARSSFDGYVDGDTLGDRSRRLWFVNLPEKCNVQIYTLAGDLVDEFEHDGNNNLHDIITMSKASLEGVAASGIHSWNLLSKNNQVIASGLYFFSVKDHKSGNIKVGKFAIIR